MFLREVIKQLSDLNYIERGITYLGASFQAFTLQNIYVLLKSSLKSHIFNLSLPLGRRIFSQFSCSFLNEIQYHYLFT